MGTLYLVSTPIGNLADMSPRAIDTLKSADLILAEDTRHTGQLLKHFAIATPLKSFYDQVESQKTPELIRLLHDGKHIALVSDAGTPLISDPGYKLVREAIAAHIPLEVIPGPSAFLAALIISGLPPDKFVFLGYPPKKGAKRKAWLDKFTQLSQLGGLTLIWYVSPHQIVSHLADLASILDPTHPLVLARELTKLHQEIIRDTLENLKNRLPSPPKGELTLLTRV